MNRSLTEVAGIAFVNTPTEDEAFVNYIPELLFPVVSDISFSVSSYVGRRQYHKYAYNLQRQTIAQSTW